MGFIKINNLLNNDKLVDSLKKGSQELINKTSENIKSNQIVNNIVSEVKTKVETGINVLTKKNKAAEEEKTELIVKEENKANEENGNKMLQIIDWAYEKANGNIPGLGTTSEMAKRYLEKEGSVTKAVESMIRWQITAAATTGFVSSLGGLATMPLTLPANIAGVIAIQLRMIGAIAELGGYNENSEEKKTGMYLCLLGSEAGNVLSKTAGQFTIKFATASLKSLPGSVLTQINQAVGFRLFTKFGNTGLVNINKLIPILGGVVGACVDGLSTYAIAKTATALFLNEQIDFEKQELIEIEKIKLLLNMALVDGEYEDNEKALLITITNSLNISDKNRENLYTLIEYPKTQKINFSLLKQDKVLAMSILSVLSRLIQADGIIHPAELAYLKIVGKELGFSQEEIADFCNIT